MSYHWLSTLSFLIVVLLADFATAAVHWDEMRIMHTWNDIPANWESLGNTTDGAMINLHIALQPERESALIDALFEVSNPSHPRYRAFLSREQAAELVSPHPETLDLVRAWLVHHGIRPSSISTTHGGSWLTIYRNSKTNDKIIRTVGYALPAVLHAHIRTVAPTTYFPSMRGMRQTPRRRSFGAAQAEAASGRVMTARKEPGNMVSFLRWLYKTESYRLGGPYGTYNRLGILGIDDDYPSPLDLTAFMIQFRTEGISARARFAIEQLNGGQYNMKDPFDGASVAVQYASAMAFPNSVVFYSVGGNIVWDTNGEPIAGDMYLEWLYHLLEEVFPPPTILIGYGEPERNLPPHYARTVCNLFADLGARGVTILVASGWNGVGEQGNCYNFAGRRWFVPEFPASCPYVTTVGGTSKFPETAANRSGGGFSSYFRRPWYQDILVSKYLTKYTELREDRYADLYDHNGRGYPDISAQALNYPYIINGEMYYMNGTICSASTVAGMISLVNDNHLYEFQPMLGFVNPLLYSRGFRDRAVNDVIRGFNPGCGTNGFEADRGWDPVTGIGTLDFEEMLNF